MLAGMPICEETSRLGWGVGVGGWLMNESKDNPGGSGNLGIDTSTHQKQASKSFLAFIHIQSD